jgi:hypothetical protein
MGGANKLATHELARVCLRAKKPKHCVSTYQAAYNQIKNVRQLME